MIKSWPGLCEEQVPSPVEGGMKKGKVAFGYNYNIFLLLMIIIFFIF